MNPTLSGPFTVRAKVVGDAPIQAIEVRVEDADWAVHVDDAHWAVRVDDAHWAVLVDDAHWAVLVDDARWASMAPVPGAASMWQASAARGERIGAWPEKGIFDTQLGPDRNGRKW